MTTDATFDAALYELASNYPHIMNVALDVPEAVSRRFEVRGPIPVIGAVDGCELRSTLVPTGGGRHRLFVNQEVRAAVGKGPGEVVTVRLRVDPSDRMPAVPPDLQEALHRWGVEEEWEALTPSRRKELLVWLADAKRPATRAHRIERIVEAAAR